MKKIFKYLATAISTLVMACGVMTRCSGQLVASHTLLALSKTDHTLAVIDPVSLKTLARIPVGEDPHEVSASSDGKKAYVSIYGGGAFHEIDIIDLVGQKLEKAVDTRPFLGPHGLTYAASKLWFTAEGSKSVGSYDPSEGKIDWSMGTGQDRTHMIYVTDDAKSLYTTNVSSGTVSILVDSLFQPLLNAKGFTPPGMKPHWDWVQTLIPVGKGSEGFDVSPDGKELWTASADDGSISIIQTKSKRLIETIQAQALGANRLKFTPDGKRVLITSLRTGDVFIYDVASRRALKRLNTGQGAAGILMDDDGSRAFLGCTRDNYVAIIDLKKLAVIGHIAVLGADGLAWAVWRQYR